MILNGKKGRMYEENSFFDIDGTLVDSFAGVKEMREDVKKSIKDLQAQGNYIFIATGRPYAF